jgi:hypothetical protein
MSEERDDGMDAPEEREPNLKNDVHRAINEAQAARRRASRTYSETRERLIEQAEATGSKDPERDAARLHAMMLKDIDRQMHSDVHAAFEKYGWSRERPQVEFSGAGRNREERGQDGDERGGARQETREARAESHTRARQRSRRLSMEPERD